MRYARRMRSNGIIFYDWPYSPFCVKVRGILDYKKADYRTVNPLAARGRLRRRGTGKVPAIEVDGRFVTDSTDIALSLDELVPDPPLFPTSRRDRALCHAIEDWAEAVRSYEVLVDGYHQAGYQLIELPRVDTATRVAFVLDHLAGAE